MLSSDIDESNLDNGRFSLDNDKSNVNKDRPSLDKDKPPLDLVSTYLNQHLARAAFLICFVGIGEGDALVHAAETTVVAL